jgi:hypothetical protein
VAGYRYLAGFEQEWRQVCGSLLRNPTAIWRRARERKEEMDEGLGGFIGEGLRGGGARVSAGEAHRRAAVVAVLAQVFLPKKGG